MSLALVAFIPGLLSRSGKKPAALVGLTLASLIVPEAAHGAGVLAPDPASTATPPIDVIPAAGPTASTVSAAIAVPELLPSPQFSANQGSAQRLAQAIAPANDGTGTVVTQTGNTFEITGGTQAGSNLFHSFEQLGLNAEQAANIIANPDIANVLGRVVGGDPSVINGSLQVTGNANLFLMNPAGIIFGPQAQVIVPGAFTATTASAIELGDYWFSALGSNEYANLVEAPSGFAFATSEPGAIINAGTLQGESLVLLGGFVVNTGTLEVGDGNISIAAVPREGLVRITQDSSLLSIDLPILGLPDEVRSTLADSLQSLTVLDIPILLSGNNIPQGLGLVLEGDAVRLVATNSVVPTETGSGGVYISGSNINLGNYSSNLPLIAETTNNIFGSGNITARSIEANSIILRARNSIMVESGITIQPIFSSSDLVILSTEIGDIKVGFINSKNGGISINSQGSFTAENYFRRSFDEGNLSILGNSINLIARNDVIVNYGVLGVFSQSEDGQITIDANNGDVEVGFIQAGWGGVDIRAAGSFRLTRSFVDRDYHPFLGIRFNPDLVDFLVSQGHDRKALPDLR